MVGLRDVVASTRAKELARMVGKDPRFVELVLRETKEVLKASREILLVEDVRGLVCINAGIDKSNVQGRGEFALLPENPDRSAEECRLRIKELTGKNVASDNLRHLQSSVQARASEFCHRRSWHKPVQRL